MSTQLAVFDFDKTVVDADSDATIIDMISEQNPAPEWESTSMDWTPYMDNMFNMAHSQGFSAEEILRSIGGMPCVRGVRQLLGVLADTGWDVLFITDANSVFVHHWLNTNRLQELVTSVITNPATWTATGRLCVRPYTCQRVCPRCPTNLCKALALSHFREKREAVYSRVVYVGDGRNDVCPMLSLSKNDVICPRAGYPCERSLQSLSPAARLLSWTDHFTILSHLFPERALHLHQP